MVESQSPADNECSNENAIPKQPAASISKKKKKKNTKSKLHETIQSEEKEKQRIYTKKYRASKATAEDKAVNNAYKRNIEHQFNLLVQKQNTIRTRGHTCTEQTKQKTIIMEDSISKFHKMIAQGPLYICTCCDQLWYKHGVRNANMLRESNPDINIL